MESQEELFPSEAPEVGADWLERFSQSPPQKHGPASRAAGAVICGILAGALIPGALANGCLFYFSEERLPGTTWLFLWGEHWAVRIVASWAAAYSAGFIAGAVARERGRLWAGISAVPSTLCWSGVAVIGWTQSIPFYTGSYEIDTSIGNKLAASLLVLSIIPIGCSGGAAGKESVRSLGAHFDSRPHTLLGVKWYHFFWLPIVIQLLLTQASWAVLYGFEWLRNTFRSGLGLGSIVPWFFTIMIWTTLVFMATGATRCYEILSRLEEVQHGRSRFVQIIKYGFGYPLGAAALQTTIGLVHYGLSKWLGNSNE